jgi:hypothetical protein
MRACFWTMFVVMPLLLVAADPTEDARKNIVAAYQRTLDALERGDAEAAMQMDTNDWVSITVGQKPRNRQEIEPFIRRDIANMKPPLGWSAVWKPDYERKRYGIRYSNL